MLVSTGLWRPDLTESVLNIPECTVMPILIVDFDTLACEETEAFGIGPAGCRIHTGIMRQRGKVIGLRLDGFDHMIRAKVTEVLRGEILVSFDFDSETNAEKRRERRRRVSIPAWVSGRDTSSLIRCEIVDASQSGCRLSSGRIADLPENIMLQIPGLDCPVPGKIMWRARDFAGVRLQWKFSNGKEFKKKNRKTLRHDTSTENLAAKNNTSGFGVRRKKSLP